MIKLISIFCLKTKTKSKIAGKMNTEAERASLLGGFIWDPRRVSVC